MPNLRTGQNQLTEAGRAGRPDRPPITPLSISYEKLLPMISRVVRLSGGLDPLKRRPIYKRPQQEMHLPQRPWSYNRDMPGSLQYLVERLIKAGHLKQYLRSDTGGRDASQAS
ncbi:hypothetical protein CK203_030153 [Vitis vinifera]|uniref:Uncharacterized protein n=1 Tax=Vitis vinifera TaxID=29760 RepID=A0A438I5I9_VITVI|nr:hypothetical protein CK203_030153 [Vitis vinifera]